MTAQMQRMQAELQQKQQTQLQNHFNPFSHSSQQNNQIDDDDEQYQMNAFEDNSNVSHRQTRMIPRTSQQSPDTSVCQQQLPNRSNDSNYQASDNFQQLQQHYGYDDPRLQKLEKSPYRQKLYFKKQNGQHGAITQIRSPSVVVQQHFKSNVQNNQFFPLPEYFNNLKNVQMRHTQQDGFVQNCRHLAPRSNSILLNRDNKTQNFIKAPVFTGDQNSQLPKTFRMTTAGAVTSTIQSSINDSDFIVDQASILQKQSKLQTRGIRYYNRVVEKFENKFYQNKTRPSSIQKRAEKIYDDNIQLKHQINQLKEQVTVQQTQNKLLNNELEKQNQLMTQILCGAQHQVLANRNNNNGMLPPPHVIIEELTVKQSELVINLKRELDKALKDIIEKDNEIKNIHKQTKVTKYRELEEECRSYMNECFRLHKVLKKFLAERSSVLHKHTPQQQSHSNLDIAPINGRVESIGISTHEMTEKVNFLKNQNIKLKGECSALAQRCEVQAQSIQSLKIQNAKFSSENESLKPLKEQVRLLSMEIDNFKSDLKIVKIEKQSDKQVIQAQTKLQAHRGGPDITNLLDEKNSEISQLQVQIQSLQSNYKQEVTKLNDFNSKIDEILKQSRVTIKEQDDMIQSFQQEIQKLKETHSQISNGQIEKFEKEKQQLIIAVSEAETQVYSLNQTIKKLECSLQSLQEQSDSDIHKQRVQYEGHIKELEQELSSKNEENNKFKTQIASLQSSQQEQTSSKDQQLADLRSDLDALKQAHQSKVLEKDSEIRQLTETVKTMQNNFSQDITFIQTQIYEKDFQIEKLKNIIKEHIEAIEKLSNQLASKQKEVQRQASHIEALTNEIETLRLSKDSIIDEDSIEKDQKIEELQLEIDILKNQVRDSADSQQEEQSRYLNQIKGLMKEYEAKLEQKDQEITVFQQKINDLNNSYEQQANQQKSEDNGLMQKLEQLMVSLQLKENDMKEQARLIAELKKDAELRDEEIIELNDQLNAKDAEITTVKNYFEKSELDQDEIRQQMDEHKKQNAQLLKNIEKISHELDIAKKKSQEGSKNAWEMDALQGEIKNLKQQLEQEKTNQLNEIQSRFTRCLEILQINDYRGVNGFLKSNDKNSDEHIEEFVAMKFNMTKEESTLLLQKVLNLSGKFTKADVINAFIQTIGNQVVIIDKDKIAKAYQQLTAKIIKKYLSVDQFFQMVNLEKSKIMHYYMMERVLFNVFDLTKEDSSQDNVASLIRMIIIHLLNQSRNFYQIEIKIFKENLELHTGSSQESQQQTRGLSKIPPSTLSAEKIKKEETEEEEYDEEEAEEEVEESHQQENYEYYDDEDYGDEVIDEEEKQINMAEEKQRTIIFNKAIKQLQENTRDTKDTGIVIQISQKDEKEQSSPGYSKALSASLKVEKSNNPILQQICKFLVQGKINLRQFLKVYHVGPKEIPFHEKEFEAISFEEFVFFIKQQNVFSEGDMIKMTENKNAKLEDALETMLDSMQCMHQVQKIGLQLIDLQILVEQLEICGYYDYPRPKSQKNFDFRILDLKSIRIMNRLTQKVYKEVEKFMIIHKINGGLTKEQNKIVLKEIIENMFKDSLKIVNVQAKTRKEKVFLIQKEDFFKDLYKLGLKGKPIVYENLSQFLRIDSQYPNLLFLKKIIRGVELFNTNGYFNSVGMRKRKDIDSFEMKMNKKTLMISN